MSKFYLDEVVEGCVRAARLLAREMSVQIESMPMPESPCAGDELLIRQAVMILLDNAVKHSGTGATVRVSLETEGDSYLIDVVDTGRGIPSEAHEKIFERFLSH